jgi:hypothetical protein
VSLVELGAGLVIARLIRRRPFESIADAALAASVAVVLKDLAELSMLGQVGDFRGPLLGLIDVVLIVVGWRVRPLIATAWRPTLAGLGSLPLAILVAVVWVGPLLLQLASPVVPFIDVLPNHVAPAEHLRTFGSFTPLTATQSPIYGPSRTLLGYVAVLGTITTLSGLPATLAAAAFILPTTILIGVAAYRLTAILAGPGAGPWALLAFALTGSFARLADDRATVIVLPLVAWALGVVVQRVRAGAGDDERAATDAWRVPEPVVVGLALGAAIFVHPVIGALAVATVGVVALAQPERAGGLGVTSVATAAVVALPQAFTMLGIALPALALLPAMALGLAFGIVVHRGAGQYPAMLRPLRIALLIAIPIVVVALGPSVEPLLAAPGPFFEATALLLIAAIVGFVAAVPAARSPVVIAAVGVGFAVAFATQLIPVRGLLGQAIRFELPKTLYYWIPAVVAVAAAGTLDWLWRTDRVRIAAGAAAVGLWVIVAAVPLRFQPIDALHLGEHRFSESLALDLRWAGTGYWTGYPDSREIVDEPRREVLAAVRGEISAGRIGPDTPVLHVAGSFQQWVATPLGVFTGVTETDVSPDAEDSIHTVGGRLLHMESLPALLASKAYPYLLFEPDPTLPTEVDTAITDAGYRPIFTNSQGTLYRLGSG